MLFWSLAVDFGFELVDIIKRKSEVIEEGNLPWGCRGFIDIHMNLTE